MMFCEMKKILKTVFKKSDNSDYEKALSAIKNMDNVMNHLEKRNYDFLENARKQIDDILNDKNYLKLVKK